MIYLVGYGTLFIITAAGIADVIYQICTFIKWLRSPKVEAVIVDVKSQIWNYGLIRFQYQFSYSGQVYTLWGSWYETFNPLLCIFPRLNLGRTVTIRIDEKKIKVVSWHFVSWIMLIMPPTFPDD